MKKIIAEVIISPGNKRGDIPVIMPMNFDENDKKAKEILRKKIASILGIYMPKIFIINFYKYLPTYTVCCEIPKNAKIDFGMSLITMTDKKGEYNCFLGEKPATKQNISENLSKVFNCSKDEIKIKYFYCNDRFSAIFERLEILEKRKKELEGFFDQKKN